MAEALAGFDRTDFGHGGTTKPVFAAGGGPAVIVMHELPGITPQLLGFARRVADACLAQATAQLGQAGGVVVDLELQMHAAVLSPEPTRPDLPLADRGADNSEPR